VPHGAAAAARRPGKVRDVYAVGTDRLLIVATDRISAFDVVLPQPIPHKGAVLTQLTAWWLARLGDITPNHLITANPAHHRPEGAGTGRQPRVWERPRHARARAEVVPIECVVRGYLSGSAWAEYRRHGTLAGEPLPDGLQESERLEPPIFSPATKAQTGHDENITFAADARRRRRRPRRRAEAPQPGRLRAAATSPRAAGIILADTKFEFGTCRWHARPHR
jgi:phosphoribosylaminoimidazole-succinocarboxamide synthase